MADEQDYPTAIVPTRPAPLAARFDRLAEQFGDPLVTLFGFLSEDDREYRFKAAQELLPYRYPKLRAQETSLRAGAGGGGTVSVTINIGGPPAPPTVDVTPEKIDPLS